MNKSESIKELAVALVKFQGEVTNPKSVADNPFFKSKYAPLDEVLNTIRPILSKHGLSVIQAPSTEDEHIVITTILIHESGEFIEPEPLKLKMDKVSAQGAGSSITYARRYALSSILGIASEEDDDGNHAETISRDNKYKPNVAQGTLSENQIKRLYAIANSAGVDANTVKAAVKQKMNKEVKDLTKKEYDVVVAGYEKLKASREV